MRGEHPLKGRHVTAHHGSSPHARGTRRDSSIQQHAPRFIPACAGNTSHPSDHVPRTAVHPRMRGEHRVQLPTDLRYHGSSPHARGTRVNKLRQELHRRFIPACAGNTASHRRRDSRETVHPRMRGEHVIMPFWALAIIGSSPHARGTRTVRKLEQMRPRFIPACAGNTFYSAPLITPIPVHPRMRGEHVSCCLIAAASSGSSPHARGTRQSRRGSPIRRRFIPACAGNTFHLHFRLKLFTVHPRMRGEHRVMRCLSNHHCGSSPHARGTRFSCRSDRRE